MSTVIYTENSVREFCCESLLAASSTVCPKKEVKDTHPTPVPLLLLNGPLFLTLMVPRAPSPMTRKTKWASLGDTRSGLFHLTNTIARIRYLISLSGVKVHA